MLTVPPGLAGVVAFETVIAEPDRDGGALRYRGIDIEKLVGKVSYADVWGLLVDGDFGAPLVAAEPVPLSVHSGDIRADAQAAIATMAPQWGLGSAFRAFDWDGHCHIGRGLARRPILVKARRLSPMR